MFFFTVAIGSFGNRLGGVGSYVGESVRSFGLGLWFLGVFAGCSLGRGRV